MRILLTEHVAKSRSLSIFSLLLSLAGVAVASIIMIEKIARLVNPEHVASCSFNPIVTCSPVMESAQASVFFGIPNPLIGVLGFGAIAMLSFLSLFVTLPRFVWVINSAGLLLALIFCFWLATQALFIIGALCVYCCGIWVITALLFWLSLNNAVRDSRWDEIRNVTVLFAVANIMTFAVMVYFAFSRFWIQLFS